MHLYSHIRSPWCRKVEISLLEMGVSQKVPTSVAGLGGVDPKIGVEEMKKACGSQATLPSLKIGDWVLSESSAIVFFLADELGYDGPYFPKDRKSRAELHQWDRIADINMGANILSPWLRNTVFLGDKPADPKVFEKCKENFVKLEERITQPLSQGGNLLGQQFTYADAALAHLILQLKTLDGPQLQKEQNKDWLQRASERPSFVSLSSRA